MACHCVWMAIIACLCFLTWFGNLASAGFATQHDADNVFLPSKSTPFKLPVTIPTPELLNRNYTTTKPSKNAGIPIEIQIKNFTATWQENEDGIDSISLTWFENSNIRNYTLIGWNLTVSSDSGEGKSKQSIIVDYDCSVDKDMLESSGFVRHRIEILPVNGIITCSRDDQWVESEIMFKSCISHKLDLIPWLDHHTHSSKQAATMLTPSIKWPAKEIEYDYNREDGTLKVNWESASVSNCLQKYRIQLKTDDTDVINTTDYEYFEYEEVPSCSNFSVTVLSMIFYNQTEMITNRSSQVEGTTGFSQKDENLMLDTTFYTYNASVRAKNQTCLLVSWSMNRVSDPLISSRRLLDPFTSCMNFSIQIHIDPPPEDQQSVFTIHKKREKGKLICTLLAGKEYSVRVGIIGNDGEDRFNISSIRVSTLYETDAATTGVIAVTVLLLFILICFGLYISRSWFYRKCNKSSNPLRDQFSFFGNFGRRNAHPIKVSDLDNVTQRLFSSGFHLLELEFEDLNVISSSRRPRGCSLAFRMENADKNRYVNILPYEHSRVSLSLLPDKPFSNYINASYVLGFNSSKEYIACQGPMASTIEDFWRMVWEQNVYVIVMVTTLEERGKIKCNKYWPDDAENPLTFNSLRISSLGEKELQDGDYTVRSFKIQMDDKERLIKQAYLKGWPDFGIPDCPEILVCFIELVRDLVNETASQQFPIVVHCSAGVGRTGTYIAVDWLMQEAQINTEIDIFSTVLRMRECRVNMVQSEEQYEYVYRCLTHFINARFHTVTENLKAADSEEENLIINNTVELDEVSVSVA